MRTTSLLLAALTLGAALASLPSASADPACATDVCINPNEPPSCNPHPPGAYDDPAITIHADCSVDIETGQSMVCVGAWYGTDERDIGPVHWTRHYCSFPGGDPLCCLSSASSESYPCTCPPPAPLCRPVNQLIADNDDAVDFTLSDSCHVTVTIDVTKVLYCYDGGQRVLTASAVTVIVPDCMGTCDPAGCPEPSAAMADPFPTCIRECSPLPGACDLKEATPTTIGPLATPFNPRAFVWGSDAGCDVDVDPVAACAPPSGFVVERTVGPVHLTLLVCDGGIGDRVGDLFALEG